MILGMGISSAFAKIIKMPPVISWQMVLAAFDFSAAVGIFFGLYPARRAAYQEPIEALRYE
jgi:putative ABC transport system permease protein